MSGAAARPTRPAPAHEPPPRRTPALWALLTAALLAAFNLRTAVTSVGPLLDELQGDLALSSTVAGVLTTLPVISFALLGALVPRLAHAMGEQRLLAVGLGLMAGGLALRALVTSGVLFLLLSVVALVGGAMGNVLLPGLVKRHFASRVGPVTAAYTTSMAIGAAVAAAATVPLAAIGGQVDWRVGLGAWAVPAAVAAAVWLVLPGDGKTAASDTERPVLRLRGSSTAWAVALFFGVQAMQAYIAFGWFALYFREQAGVSAARAGFLLAVLASLSIPMSALMPWLAGRLTSQRPLVLAVAALYLVAYTGMALAPGAAAVLWAVLVGAGAGAFPLALTLIGLRARSADGTRALSAFAQSVGYSVAAAGPLLVGVLNDATGGWGWSFGLLYLAVAVMTIAGWLAGSPRFVEDDVVA